VQETEQQEGRRTASFPHHLEEVNMNQSFASVCQRVRVPGLILGLAVMAIAIHGLAHSAFHGAILFVATLVAVACIWLPNPTVRGWAWTAFIVLLAGMLPLVVVDHSVTALALVTVAAGELLYRHRRRAAPQSQPPFQSQLIVCGTQVWVPLETKITPQSDVSQPELSTEPVVPTASVHAEPVVPAVPVAPPAPPAAPVHAPRPRSAPVPTYDFSDCVRTPRYAFDAVVGMADTKKRLLAAAQDVFEGSEPVRNGILLFGEPGNGKTLFAEALAGQLGVPFLSIAFGDAASMWVNETPQKVKAIFNTARKLGTCVLFIDEIDSFLKSRDGHAHHMDRDLTNVMLTETVALRGSKVILLAATNFIDSLDGAGIREGRFDFRVEIPAPDLKAREVLIWRTVRALGEEFVDRSAIESLARRWEGFSVARLTALRGQLREMHREHPLTGPVTFDTGMRAMRLLQGRKGRLPENVKAIDEILMPEASRDTLRDLAFRMKHAYDLEQVGGRLPPGVIFAGPPGTGKTMSAMALAKQADWAFLSITGAEIIADPKAWDRLYRTACDIRPAIVFLDEADGILRDRQSSHYGMLTEKILTTMDGAGGRVRDVLFVAATNYCDRIDAAALRGGRFEEKIAFDVPGASDMAAYIGKAFVRLETDYRISKQTIRLVINHLAGRSIADADAVIQKTVDSAAVRRLRERTCDIRQEDVRSALDSVLPA
jgi:transitional endoplasmic reticulum ATPase